MNLEIIVLIIIFTFFANIVSLLGGLILLWGKVWEGENIVHLLAFAAGVLLATAFLDLLPEAQVASKNDPNIFVACLVGIISFFFLERFLIYFHPHNHLEEKKASVRESVLSLVIVGDAFHNIIDGFAIATSFLVSIPLGIITALAVSAHEIPKEISDFIMLLRGGMKVRKAIIVNILAGLAAMVGAFITLLFSSVIESYLGLLLAFTAGMFIYLASSTIIPELQHVYLKERKWHQAIFFVIGIAAVYLVIQLLD